MKIISALVVTCVHQHVHAGRGRAEPAIALYNRKADHVAQPSPIIALTLHYCHVHGMLERKTQCTGRTDVYSERCESSYDYYRVIYASII